MTIGLSFGDSFFLKVQLRSHLCTSLFYLCGKYSVWMGNHNAVFCSPGMSKYFKLTKI